MLPCPMFSSQSSPSPSPSPDSSLLCALDASPISSFPLPFNFELSTINFLSLSPFPAILTGHPELNENKTTLSLAFVTLTSTVTHNPFACHSYKKHPGWQSVIINFFVAQTSVCAFSRRSASERSQAKHPHELENLAVMPVTSHKSPVTAWVLSLPPVTSHQSPITKSFIIRTSAKPSRNPFGIRTSKSQDLKPFRMNTYEKTGGGGSTSFKPKSSIASFGFPLASRRPHTYARTPGHEQNNL